MSGGGIIEGLKVPFRGKNLLLKHLVFMIVAVLLAAPNMLNFYIKGLPHRVAIGVLGQFFAVGFIALIVSVILGLYMTKFLQNVIHYNTLTDSPDNTNKFASMQLLPELNSQIFNKWKPCLIFFGVWILYMIIMFAVFAFGMFITLLAQAFIPLIFLDIIFVLFIFCYVNSFMYIMASFAVDYQPKGKLSPVLLLKYLPKVFHPTFWWALLVGLINVTIYSVFSLILILCGVESKFAYMFSYPVLMYSSILLSLALYYAAGSLYYKKFIKEKTIS